jgi:hypothetical protein
MLKQFVKNTNYRKFHFPLVSNFVTLLILLVFTATLGIFGYRQFSRDAKLTAAYPSSPITPNRQLSFQGRLENASGTPITSATNLTFKLWNQLSGGTEGSCTGGSDNCLYSTSSCSITPDADGIFSTQIGSACGAGIPATVFTENSNIWLEVVVATETLTPRQPIASVAYALNSETIQGFPLSSTVSAIRNTVVPMNQWGEIIVGEQSPRLTGVSGTFQISAPSISITTATGTNGNITLAPDGTGQVNLNGNTTSTNFFNVSNAQLTTGSLLTGTVANNNTGFKLINLLSGSSPTSKFSVDNSGATNMTGGLSITNTTPTILLDDTDNDKWNLNTGSGQFRIGNTTDDLDVLFIDPTSYHTTLAGDLTVTGDDLFMNTNTAGYLLIADGTNFNPIAVSGDMTINSTGVTAIGADKITESMLKSVNAPTDEMCLSYESTVGDFEWQSCGSAGSGSSNWRINLGALSPLNDTLDLLVGSNATASAKAGFLNINNGTPTATVSAGTAGGAFLTATGTLATTARQSLTLGNSAAYDTTGNVLLNPNGTGNVGIGVTNPTSKLQIGGTSSTISNGSGDLTIDSFSGNTVFGTDDDLIPTLGAGSADLGSTSAPWDNLYSVAGNFAGDITLSQADPSIFFTDTTASADDYSLNIDASALNITNATDSRVELSFDGAGSIDLGDNTTTKTIHLGGNTNSAADTIQIATNATSADTITIGNSTAGTTTSLIGGDASVINFTKFDVNSSGIISLIDSVAHTLDDVSGNLTLTSNSAYVSIADDLQITGGDILDSNGNENVRFGTTASAVNEFTLTNAATGGIVTLAATGGDTDIALSIDAKGSDPLNLNNTGTGNVLLAGGSAGTGCTVTNSNGDFACTGTITAGTITATALPFSGITSATNTVAAMVVGTGASLNYTGSGTINASTLLAGTWAIPGTIGSTTPNTAAFTTLTSSGNSTIGTGASSINTIGSTTTPGTLTLHGATTLDNTFTVSGANLTTLGGGLNITGATNFAGGSTYYVDASGNAKFLDLQVVDTGNPGLTVGNGTIGYAKIGGSTISDNNGDLTLDSDSTQTVISDDLAISGGNITTALTADSTLTTTGTLTANGTFDANGAVTLGDGGDSIHISGSTFIVDIAGVDEITLTSSALSPSTSDSNALGTGTNMWSDLFLAAASVINFNNGDVTITHSADLLTIAGGGVTTSGTLTANGTLDANGIFALGDNGDTGAIDTSDWNINATGDMSGIGTITSDGAITTTINDATNNNITNVLTLAHTTSGTPTAASSNFSPDQTNSLGNDLAVYYKFDETAGSRIDSAGPIDLTLNGTTSYGTGIKGNASDFESTAGTNYVWAPSSSFTSIGESSMTIATWVKIESYAGTTGAIASIFDPAKPYGYYLYTSTSESKIRWYAACADGTTQAANIASSATVSTGAWHFVVAIYDKSTNTMSLQIDNGTVASATVACQPLMANAVAFIMGVPNGGAAGTMYDGMIDEFGLWHRTLTTQEKSDLYNAGSANTCTDDCNDPTTTTPGIGTGILLRSEDASGNAEDQARISSLFNTATNGTETSSLLFETRVAGAALARNMRLDGAGNITARGNIFGGGLPDIAENIRTTDSQVSAGDIVMIDQSYVNPDPNDTYNKAAITRATTPYGEDLIGVISSNPGLLLNSSSSSLDGGSVSHDDERPLVLAGRVPVKVSTAGGPIALGDRITASPTAGVGMKATKAGRIIGTALEPLICETASCTGTILVMVGAGWYEPKIDLAQTILSLGTQVLDRVGAFSTLIAESIKGRSLEIASISPLVPGEPILINGPVTIAQSSSELSDEPLLVIDGQLDAATISARVALLQNLEVENITAKNIVADTISANHIEGLDAKIASMSGALSDADLTSITGRIKARLAELSGNLPTAADIPVPEEATPSATVTQWNSDTASSSATLNADFATINNYLAVIGSATITTLDVTSGLYTESIGSKTGHLALLENTLIIDSSGHVAINGDLTITGKILASSAELDTLSLGNPQSASPSSELGKLLSIYNEQGVAVATIDASGSANLAALTTGMITIASPAIASESALSSLLGTAKSNATAGQSVLLSPNTELTLESPYITSNSLVYLTPTGNTDNKVVFVKSKNTCDKNNPELAQESPCTPSFTVAIDTPASSDISFNWWIIELKP